MTLFIYQIKQAVLSLKQSPVFVFSIVSTMGISFGALLCALTLAYVMLFKPLPYQDQNRLFTVEHQLVDNQNHIDGNAFTYPNLMYLYRHQSVFEQSALMYLDGGIITSLSTEPMVEISFVTPSWFSLFNSKAHLGRLFDENEGLDSYNPVAIITYQMWQGLYTGTADIIGKSITFGDKNYKIIGVISPDYVHPKIAGAAYQAQVFLPWDYNTVSDYDRKQWGNDDGGLMYVGKLSEPLSVSNSTDTNSQVLTQLVNDNWQNQVVGRKFFNDWRIQIKVHSLIDTIVGESKYSIYLLVAGAIGLALIACANIANLFVSRTAQQQQQLAIKAALGASKKQLYFDLMIEVGLLMLLAMGSAQVVAALGFSLMEYYFSSYIPRISELSLNSFSSVSSLTIVVFNTLAFTFICQRMINYRNLNASINSSGKGNAVQVSKKLRTILISWQVAVAFTLVFSNVMLFQESLKLSNRTLGYQTDNIYSAVLSLPDSEVEENYELKKSYLAQLKEKLSADPRIEQVSQGMRPSIFSTLAITIEKTQKRYSTSAKDVDHLYFPLIGQPIILGENFSAADIADNNSVVIVNDIMANELAPDGQALGITFTNGARIIGVVKSINIPGSSISKPRFYFPAHPSRNMILIKLKAGQNYNRDELISTIKSVNNRISLFSFATLEHYKNERLFVATVTTITAFVVILLTLLLSGLGLFGVLTYLSQMRRFEIGTRMAIGAKGRDIIATVIKE
ncbi:ABC transporter permease, partial [Thalassotalea profundi]|uniref:ABC transporter permease n=1 Tax=Thalassotalea profundi TaxID=2036687 RepID=UPI0016791C04